MRGVAAVLFTNKEMAAMPLKNEMATRSLYEWVFYSNCMQLVLVTLRLGSTVANYTVHCYATVLAIYFTCLMLLRE